MGGAMQSPPQAIVYRDEQHALLIRPLEEGDAEPIYDAVQASREILLPFMDWAHSELSVEAERERIQGLLTSGADHDCVVLDQLTGQLLMCSGWRRGKALNRRSIEIGYWTHIGYLNRGLATLVTRAIIVAAFDHLQIDRVEIGCNRFNEASHRVIQKCDFRLEGQVRNYYAQPSPEMVANGYCADRTYLQYGLVPDDIPTLPWYEATRRCVSVEGRL